MCQLGCVLLYMETGSQIEIARQQLWSGWWNIRMTLQWTAIDPEMNAKVRLFEAAYSSWWALKER